MNEYWSANIFLPKGWETWSGTAVRDYIRQRLWAFHNAVNARLEKPLHPPLDPLTLSAEQRAHVLAQVTAIFSDVPGIPQNTEGHVWRRTFHLLVSLLHAGPFPI